MEQLAKKAAEMALRLSALPAGRRPDSADLDGLEQLANDVPQQVSAARLDEDSYAIGEIRGCWRERHGTR
jgi:hypothetical protein